MNEILKTTLLGLFFGTFGTTLGGFIGILINKNSNKFLSFILSFASGLMMAVICFDLIPEALGISNVCSVVLGVIIGVASMIFCDVLVQKFFNKKSYKTNNNLLKTGIIVSIGLAIHNFPEGLAIGSGFEASLKLGLGLAIAICLHDIPEARFQKRHFYKNAWNIIWVRKGDIMFKFILGLIIGANLSLFLYACIIAGKESDEGG